jgi:hypothetical protein
MTGMTGPACREIRQLLGIHMVGASQEAMAVCDRRWSLPCNGVVLFGARRIAPGARRPRLAASTLWPQLAESSE